MLDENKKQVTKIVHVHFIHGHKNFYFGSVSAIYRKFSEEEIGCTADFLRHQLSYDGSSYINKNVAVWRSHLLR